MVVGVVRSVWDGRWLKNTPAHHQFSRRLRIIFQSPFRRYPQGVSVGSSRHSSTLCPMYLWVSWSNIFECVFGLRCNLCTNLSPLIVLWAPGQKELYRGSQCSLKPLSGSRGLPACVFPLRLCVCAAPDPSETVTCYQLWTSACSASLFLPQTFDFCGCIPKWLLFCITKHGQYQKEIKFHFLSLYLK